MPVERLGPEAVLALIPQQPPFRFIDCLYEVSSEHALGSYTYRPDEYFYRGHFPGNPVTPGVILIETLCQTGVVALGIYLASLEAPPSEIAHYLTLFTECEIEFFDRVMPGDKVLVRAEKIYWRMRKLRSRVTMKRESDGKVVAAGTVSGMGVKV